MNQQSGQTGRDATQPQTIIWLASKSPRRAQLLEQAGIGFEFLLPMDADAAELLEAHRTGESPRQYVSRVARAKLAMACESPLRQSMPARAVLCADTTVALGGRMLGKPADREECAGMLSLLSGRTHRVLTAVAVARGNKVKQLVQVSRVRFARLSQADIAGYAAGGEGLDKAGGYAIQGAAARFVRNIEGSYSGIMGLPLYETCRLLAPTK